MVSRDLAATDALVERAQRGLRASRDRRGERDAEIIRDLAVEGLQAMDDIAVELRRIAALERQAADAQAERDEAWEVSAARLKVIELAERGLGEAEARVMRAEEALRQIADETHPHTPVNFREAIRVAREALAAAGADTPPPINT